MTPICSSVCSFLFCLYDIMAHRTLLDLFPQFIFNRSRAPKLILIRLPGNSKFYMSRSTRLITFLWFYLQSCIFFCLVLKNDLIGNIRPLQLNLWSTCGQSFCEMDHDLNLNQCPRPFRRLNRGIFSCFFFCIHQYHQYRSIEFSGFMGRGPSKNFERNFTPR